MFEFLKFGKMRGDAKSAQTPSLTAPDASLRDPVTSLYSKSHLLRRLEEGCARVDRDGSSLILVLWDIDGFVQFNNQFGQAQGDDFLRRVAGIIKAAIRVYDEAFRVGGDEFCALLVPADVAVAEDVKARVAEAISQGLFKNDPLYQGKQFSISSGHTLYPGPIKGADALLHEAFQGLYRNQKGRRPGMGE